VGTPVAEGELYRWLKLEPQTKETLHGARAIRPAPATALTTPGVLQQITAERLVAGGESRKRLARMIERD
jgi:hypothetical protein